MNDIDHWAGANIDAEPDPLLLIEENLTMPDDVRIYPPIGPGMDWEVVGEFQFPKPGFRVLASFPTLDAAMTAALAWPVPYPRDEIRVLRRHPDAPGPPADADSMIG